MEFSAICHFADKRWCYALGPDRFLIRLRVKRGDMRRVTLHWQDKYLPIQFLDTRASADMSLAARDKAADYYELELTFHLVCLRYWFELEDHDGRVAYYANYEFRDRPPEDVERMFDCPQNLREEEMFRIPAWARNAVGYQIFPTRFAPNREPDPELWYATPVGQRRLGGTLRGITERLDYLRDLGVDVLYLNPIFTAETQHKYDTVDYLSVDPELGTGEDLRELVDRAHALGLRVMLDGVFNHSSRRFFAFADILEHGAESKYLDWYFIESLPPRAERGRKPNYKTFSYVGSMPKLNLRNPETEAYFIGVGLHWLREYAIDGWRLDVADEVGHRFWRNFREAVKAERPDALIVGEEWHFAGDFLEGDAWDTVMNYDFLNAARDLAARGETKFSDFMDTLGFLRGNLHREVFPVLWNLIGTHDTSRFLSEAGGDRRRLRFAAALQLLLPGMPVLYYGDEVGMEGPDPGEARRGMLWDPARQDRETLAWYRDLIRVRHKCPCLTEGAVTGYASDDNTGLLRMTRTLGTETVTLLLHAGEGGIHLPELTGRPELIAGGPFPGTLGPWGAAVIQNSTESC